MISLRQELGQANLFAAVVLFALLTMAASSKKEPISPESYVGDSKCLSCHARTRVQESQAPMVSITHFFDRDGQALASISPRRYFCTQCHVPQHTVRAPVENDFVDIDTLLSRAAPGGRR